jgi:hypothetical protein
MPSRVLRDYTDSLSFDGISAEAERLFIRLICKADDFGRFHADPRLIKAACFPLVETIRANDLSRWLDELSHRQLILCYESGGRKLLAIVNYGQRLKQSRAKFPAPGGESENFLPTSRNFPELPARKETKRKEVETNPKGNESETEEEKKGTVVPDALLAVAGFAEAWATFRKHRQKIRKPMTDRAEELILQTLATRPEQACEAVDLSIRKGWQDINWDWFDNSKNQKLSPENNQRTSKFSWH